MKDIVLLGSGGLAREVAWLIEQINITEQKWNILGYVSKDIPGTKIGNYPILGDDKWLLDRKIPTHAVCCVGEGTLRKKIIDKVQKNSKIQFPNIISRDVMLNDSINLGIGNIITKSCILTVDIKLGDFNIINLNSTIGHDCHIGSFVTLNPGCNISGNVTLCDGVTIGTGASCIQGITIYQNTTVGAGATVIRDIEANTVAVGIPAKSIRGKDNV